ncbi:hypothetical protein D9M70_592030 [compost metagenome]
MSMIVNFRFGNSAATFCRAVACEKPTAMIGEWPSRAKRRSACSIWASLVGSKSRNATPVSVLNFSAPMKTPSLKDLSNFPPLS